MGEGSVREPMITKGVWHRPTERSDEQVRKTLTKAAELNINTLYLESWYNGKFIGYSGCKLVQRHTDIYGDFDVLESYCRIGHELGISIHAWTENFFIGLETDLEDKSNEFLTHFQDKLLIDKAGRRYNETIYGPFIFLNPYDKECRSFILDFYKDMVKRYDIDGLHMDYIRFPEPNGEDDFGYNKDIIEGFCQYTGRKIDVYNPTPEEKKEWDLFRQRIISSFVAEVHTGVKEIKSDIWLSCACFPYLDTAPTRIYQNVDGFMADGLLDEVISMSYTLDASYVERNAKEFVELCHKRARYSVGLAMYNKLPGSEMLKQLTAAYESGAGGVSLFAFTSLDFENYAEIVKDFFSK